jgi:hypothetical protein
MKSVSLLPVFMPRHVYYARFMEEQFHAHTFVLFKHVKEADCTHRRKKIARRCKNFTYHEKSVCEWTGERVVEGWWLARFTKNIKIHNFCRFKEIITHNLQMQIACVCQFFCLLSFKSNLEHALI